MSASHLGSTIDDVEAYVNGIISNNEVAMFSKTTCSFCTKAKEKFSSIKQVFKCVELDLIGENGTKIQNYLFLKTKQKTVPNIFIRGIHIGGWDATNELFKSGKMYKLLDKQIGDKLDPLTFINKELSKSGVVIYSKTTCPYCKKAKEMFQSINQPFTVFELDLMGDDGPRIQNALFEKSGQRTVPNIFVNGKHIGGCDATLKLFESGDIHALLGENSGDSKIDPRKFVDTEVSKGGVVIFSKTTCPYCKKAKEKFQFINQPFTALELDLMGDDGNRIQNALLEKSGQKTVPNIFINGKHIGGCDATLKLFESGNIHALLGENSGASKIDPRKFVDTEVSKGGVVIFSKTTCPYCKKAKEKFQFINQPFTALELDLMGDDGIRIQNALFEKSGQKTVPNIFINGKHIGGCDAALKLFESGDIHALLGENSGASKIDPRKFVDTEVSKGGVVIFSKTTCPDCKKAKEKFQFINQPFTALELDLMGDDGIRIQNALFEKSGQKTVPNIFINGKHIGGCDATLELFETGAIYGLLKAGTHPLSSSNASKVDWIIENQPLVVFGHLSDALKNSMGSPNFVQQEIDDSLIQELYKRTGQLSPPFIFYKGLCVTIDELLNINNVFLDINKYVSKSSILIYSKTACPFCKKAKSLLAEHGYSFKVIELDLLEYGSQIQGALFEKTSQKTVPNIFINGQHVGGCSDLQDMHKTTRLYDYIAKDFRTYDYDFCVIGGGSGGIAASKEAASLNKKVALFDFVTPSQHGTVWGLGGTCVNVGCIPKKLFHKASLLNEEIDQSENFGFHVKQSFEWSTLVENVQKYIHGLNNNYVQELAKNKIDYYNEKATFVDKHTVQLGNGQRVTAQNFLIAVGGRPSYPNIPGAHLGISSDDLFSLKKDPGKVLLVGASYIALECAGFLHGLGYDTTVMVRSILLRGFDQDIANMIGDDLTNRGVKFLKPFVPIELLKQEGDRILVKAEDTKTKEVYRDVYDTVVFAIGRTPCTADLNLPALGIQVSEKNQKIITTSERTSVPNIFAVGDVINNAPELTPVAIKAGKLLVKRLYGKSEEQMNYKLIPTTVFTPLEYGCIGYSEAEAKEKFKNVVVYHNQYVPLENAMESNPRKCYAKLVCDADGNYKVIGFHILGTNAGEITQGFAIGMMMGATKSDFDNLIGIHPTCAEVFTTMNISKESNKKLETSGC